MLRQRQHREDVRCGQQVHPRFSLGAHHSEGLARTGRAVRETRGRLALGEDAADQWCSRLSVHECVRALLVEYAVVQEVMHVGIGCHIHFDLWLMDGEASRRARWRRNDLENAWALLRR